MNELNILMVDDDEVDVETVRRALRRRGISNPLHVARDGVEALDLLLGREGCKPLAAPRIILLDLNMPRMDGFEFLAELRRHPAHEEDPVFVLTTSDDDRHRARAHQLGVAGYIVKDELPLRALDLVLLGLQAVPDAVVRSVDVGALVRRLMTSVDPDGHFQLSLPPSVLLLETAGERLAAVLRALLENAVQHHDRGHGVVAITWEEYDDVVQFRVQDDGPGIPPSRAREIFQPLHSTKVPAGQAPHVGDGMGLTLAHQIVGAAGGTISVQGTLSRGATFTFTWPTEWVTPGEVPMLSISPLEEAEEPTGGTTPRPPAADPTTVTLEVPTAGRALLPFDVLLVDDDEVDRAGMRRAMARRGPQDRLLEAATADEALVILGGGPGQPDPAPTVVILDLFLAGHSGVALLDAIRATPRLCGLPVFVLSNSQDPTDRRRAALRHVAGFILKEDVAPGFERVVDLLEAYGAAVRP